MDNYSEHTCNGKGCNNKSTCKRYTEWVKAFREDREVEEFETAPFLEKVTMDNKTIQACEFRK